MASPSPGMAGRARSARRDEGYNGRMSARASANAKTTACHARVLR